MDAYLGDWYFNQYPDSGLSIEKIGDEYYLSLTVVQGNGLRFNGTMEPARLIDQGSYFATVLLLHYAGNNSSCPDSASGKPTWLYPAQKKA